MFTSILSPNDIIEKYPLTSNVKKLINDTRDQIRKILNQEDDRLIIIVGPCSIHNPEEAIDYAKKLKEMVDRHKDHLLILMRTYIEKPRTNIGWKGLIHDPDLDGSCNLKKGIEVSRQLFLQINELGLPCATEFLDLLTPHYISDLVSWGCLGARTVESQPHRQMASGLELPMGYKNGTTGSVKIAVDAIISANQSHSYLTINQEGKASIYQTIGNQGGHVILRGGWDGPTIKPNYYMEDVQKVTQLLQYTGLKEIVVIDCSHGNSMKKYQNQVNVASYLAEHIAKGNTNVVGLMLESNINEGQQTLHSSPNPTTQLKLKYGVSVTDACINLKTTEEVLEELSVAVKARRHLI